MSTALTFLILIAPFAVAALLSWAAHRDRGVRGLSDDDRDGFRVAHDLDAIRTRFEKQPFWPASGATGERR
ncbi:hypothetical protein [Mycobacterium sp. 1274761.0]|uniref:hypothetical protein n=1 Tax=Mycobacterium sp. 1274761.0 TaxID=1834077 RepID=UPI0008018697|nr:hypothetical protein [Mycobacterium sp. 1274761.0]OBK79032.1 hypothetical protein A5651_24545 [Mycobacterium sp. 1274761.0]